MKLLLSFFLFLIPFFTFSQVIMVSEHLSIRNDLQYELIGKLKDRYLMFRDKANEYEIQAFNHQLQTTWNKTIEFDKKRVHITALVSETDKFHIFYTFKKKGRYFLKVKTFDPGANMIDSSLVWDYGQQFYPPSPDIKFSKDKKKLLIYQLKQQSKIEALAYDVENYKTLWDMQFDPEEFNPYRDHSEWVINNDGAAYFIIAKDNRKARKEDHHYLIHSCKAGLTAPLTASLHMKGKMTYDVKFDYDHLNKRLVAGGFYSEKSRGKTVGSFYININPNNADDHVLEFQPFEKQFMNKIMEKRLDQDSKGITDISVKAITLRRDGGILLTAERKKHLERRLATAGRGYVGRDGSRYIVDYYYDDIFVTSIHPDGKMHWQTILHKKQYSQDDDAIYSSFFLMKTPTSLRFIFNDEIRRENTVSEYILEGDGAYDRNSVMNTDDQEIQLRFRDAIQINSKECLIPSEFRNKLRLVKINY